MLSRSISIRVGLALSVLLAVLFIVSCDEQERYDTLKFFFDGVETPEPLKVPVDFTEPNLSVSAQQPQGPIWYTHKPVHEPPKKCNNCHDTKRMSWAGGRAYLNAPVPQLCYGCHDDFTASAPNIHGPVAVGQCLQCHNPHKSKIRYLLEKPVPEICYNCHDSDSIASIPAHFVSDLSSCTDCHDPHASMERHMLKEAARRLSKERAITAPIGPVEKPEIQGQVRTQAPSKKPETENPELRKRKQKIADIFYASMDLYRQGRFVEARKGFVTVLNSGLIPQAMGTMILGYISDIDKRLAERTK